MTQPWHEDFWTDGDTGEPLRRRESELNAYLAADVAPAGPPLHEQADRDGDNVPSDRVHAYTDVLVRAMTADNHLEPWEDYARAVMAVADREQAALRANRDAWQEAHSYEFEARKKAEDTIARVEAILWDHPNCIGECACAVNAAQRIIDGPKPTEEPS